MRAILAVSADGYLARSEDDDMQWLGPTDKSVFRIVTALNGRLGVSVKTAQCMPANLTGRKLHLLSRTDLDNSWGSLECFSKAYPDAWLIGGPTLFMLALESGMLNEVVVCQSDRWASPKHDPAPAPIPDTVTPWLAARGNPEEHMFWWKPQVRTKLNDLTVVNWRCRGPVR